MNSKKNMILIKIDKKTIRKNPNAGSTVSYISNGYSAEFEIEGHIPKFIHKPPFYIEEWKKEDGIFTYVRGKIIGAVEQRHLDKAPNLHLIIHNDIITINHLPEPDYFFSYKETYLECKHCGSKIEIDQIVTDYEDDYQIQICPACNAMNSFPKYKYQTIEEVLHGKRKNIQTKA